VSGSNDEDRALPVLSESNDEVRALRVMVEELRAEAPPELPWDAIERRLMAEIGRLEDSSRAPSRSGLARAFTFAAAAAVLLLGGLSAGSGERAREDAAPRRAVDAAAIALAPGAAGQRGARDLLSLKPGDVIETRAAPVTFSRQGAVAWTLAPESRAVVRSLGADGIGHTVALERGSMRAEVTPRDPAEGLIEAFAVEIGNTRVAVHGTAFSVMREGEHVIVDVEHGSVAVGPRGPVGMTTGHLLVGPRRAAFSLDGGRTALLLARADEEHPKLAAAEVKRESAPAEPTVIAAAPALAREARSTGPVQAPLAKTAAPPLPPAPSATAEPAKLTAATVRARLAQCFENVYGSGSSSLEVSVSSTLHIVCNSDGSVQSARFDPPLKPEFQVCAGGAISGRFAEGGGSFDIPITMKR
jgi:hypothetical protein